MTGPKRIVPVILAGGGGTRLWPLSRGYYPKQFLNVGGTQSLLQETLSRLASTKLEKSLSKPIVVCNEEHRFLVAEQCRQIAVLPSALMLEPVGRNTAPAVTVAALHAQRGGGDPVLVIMPADQLVADKSAFAEAVEVAIAEAGHGEIVTLGVAPDCPHTGYGYIEVGPAMSATVPASHRLLRFHEKPDRRQAENYVSSGRFLWNAGVFVMHASVWLARAEQFCPDIVCAARQAESGGSTDGDFFRVDGDAFERCPATSVDYAVMEALAGEQGGAAVVSLDAGWSDVGSWASLWGVLPKDADGNVTHGDVCVIDSHNNVVMAEHRLVATLGCDDLVIIETADSVMVAPRERAEDVKAIVQWLTDQARVERLTHREVYRPWGSYSSIDEGSGFQVKRITVKPGEALSLQLHNRRAEHWIVVRGRARVIRGEDCFELGENQSIDIPIGTKHRLENPTADPIELIEVQSGSYLGEDDIVRFDDRYRRA